MALYTFDELASKGINKSMAADTASKILLNESWTTPWEQTFNIFLSHSYFDSTTILELKKDIERMQYTVYVDWLDDRQLSREYVSRETAEILRHRMNKSDCLLYVASDNSPQSKWMPWELGYFDALKGHVAILPISNVQTSNFPTYEGLEYLGLYYYVDKCRPKGETKPTLWINEASNKYVSLTAWLDGKEPTLRK